MRTASAPRRHEDDDATAEVLTLRRGHRRRAARRPFAHPMDRPAMIVLNGLDDVRDPGRNDFYAAHTIHRMSFIGAIEFFARHNLTPHLPRTNGVH